MHAAERDDPLQTWMAEPWRDPFRDRFRHFLRGGVPALRAPAEMRVDVSEDDRACFVKAGIPGARKQDIRVKVDGNLVSIDAEVKEDRASRGDGERVLTREIYRGAVSRAFTLAHEIADQEAKASFDNGVLSLTLPKRAEARGTSVAID